MFHFYPHTYLSNYVNSTPALRTYRCEDALLWYKSLLFSLKRRGRHLPWTPPAWPNGCSSSWNQPPSRFQLSVLEKEQKTPKALLHCVWILRSWERPCPPIFFYWNLIYIGFSMPVSCSGLKCRKQINESLPAVLALQKESAYSFSAPKYISFVLSEFWQFHVCSGKQN